MVNKLITCFIGTCIKLYIHAVLHNKMYYYKVGSAIIRDTSLLLGYKTGDIVLTTVLKTSPDF